MSRTNAFENGLRWWPIERQNMFTDAVFSIAATIAVANLEIKKTDPETVTKCLYVCMYGVKHCSQNNY